MRLTKILAVNFFIFVGILFVLELVFSYANPLRNLPQNGFINDELFTWGHKVEVNRLGFREREIEIPKSGEVFRVAVLGDSLTWGAGLSESQRYTNMTEEFLQKKFPEKNIEVLNFGISGGPMISHYKNLDQLKGFIDADLIVVGFCLNDPQPRSQDYSVEREQFLKKFNVFFEILDFLEEFIPNLAKNIKQSIWVLLERKNLVPTWYEAIDRVYDKNSREWGMFSESLHEIYNISESLGLPDPLFLILNQGSSTIEPTFYGNPDPVLEKFIGWYDQAESEAESIGFRTVNHMQEFIDELNGEVLGVNILDGHPSHKENIIYAKKLAETIEKKYIH